MKMYYKYILAAIILIIGLSSCTQQRTVIAISKASGSDNYKNYEKWLKRNAPSKIKTIDLYGMKPEEAQKVLNNSHGLLLTGGPDVHPGRYGKEADTARCSIDFYRDTLEFAVIEKALELNIPILGICRGMQVLNVYKGGTLIVDIPEDVPLAIVHQIEDADVEHNVTVFSGTQLYAITEVSQAVVNSNHHQAIGVLSEEFQKSAASDDGLIEALEWRDKRSGYFLLAVGWHPERLPKGHPLSDPLAYVFLQFADEYKQEIIENE